MTKRTLFHVTVGDESWNPTQKNLDDIKAKFENVTFDADGNGFVVTNNGVFTKLVHEFESDEPPQMTKEEIKLAADELCRDVLWQHKNGNLYRVVMLTNMTSDKPQYVPTVVYEGLDNGLTWSRPISRWYASFTKYTNAGIA